MANPLDIPDKAGQGALWSHIRRLSDAFVDATNQRDTREAGRVERRLELARQQLHRLHNHKERP